MPAYNSASSIREAVQSILDQTEKNWELIVLDDHSTDDTLSVLESIRDPRMVVIRSVENRGQSYQFNKGIGMAKGEFIAVAHADDINEPRRLEEQLKVFNRDTRTGVVGTWITYMGDRSGSFEYPVGHDDCFVMMIDDSPLAHPTVMMRKSVLDQMPFLYRQEFVPAEDYDLWARLINITRFDNVPQFLLRYRFHDHQISKIKQSELGSKVEKIKSAFIHDHLGSLDAAQQELLHALISLEPGGLITRALIKGSGKLASDLSACSHIEKRKWKKKINQLLARGLIISKRYEAGAGIWFLVLNPGQLLISKPADTVRMIWRSIKTG